MRATKILLVLVFSAVAAAVPTLTDRIKRDSSAIHRSPETNTLDCNIVGDVNIAGVLQVLDLSIDGLTASRLVATNASNHLISSDLFGWVAGVTGEIIVTDDTDGTITLGIDPAFGLSGAAYYSFKTITGITNNVVADSNEDTLTLSASGPLTIVGTTATDTITFTVTEADPIYAAWIAGPPNVSEFTNDAAYLTVESDPIYGLWIAGPPNISTFTNDVPYLTVEVDGSTTNELQNIFQTITGITNDVVADSTTDSLTLSASGPITIVGTTATDTITFTVTETDPELTTHNDAFDHNDIADGATAYSWGDHSLAGYLTSYSETDPCHVLHLSTYDHNDIADGATAYSWGDHSLAGYLTSYSETDPCLVLHNNTFDHNDIADGETAYGWGDHSLAGYLTTVDISANTNLAVGDLLTLTDDTLDANTAAVANGDTKHLATGDQIYDFVTGSYLAIDGSNANTTIDIQGEDLEGVGHLGVGATGLSGSELVYIESSKQDLSSSLWGLYYYLGKTDGASSYGNTYEGLHFEMDFDQTGGSVGTVNGLNYQVNITDMIVGRAANNRDVTGLRQEVRIDDDVWGDVYGWYSHNRGNGDANVLDDFFGIYNENSTTGSDIIGGDLYGYYGWVYDASNGVAGTVYQMYLKEGSNVDYCIYQNGSAPSLFGGIVTVGDGSLLATSAAPTTDAMIANKKYVDDQVAGASGDMTKAVYDVLEDDFVDGNETIYAASWNGNINAPTMNAVYDKIQALTFLATADIDTFAELDAIVADKALVNKADGAVWLGVHDFGGADSVEIPNTAGDVTLSVPGQIAVDSTQKQLAVYDGNEVVIPLRHMIFAPLYLTGAYDIATDYALIHLDSTMFPNGIVITGWSLSSTVADPTTELDANLLYCDNISTGALPGANPVLIDVLDSTTGNSSETNMASSDLGSGTIPTDKYIYVDMDVDPTDTTSYWILKVEFLIPES
jgi:hypothetical protein